ncbi:MAG: hydroxyacylglutathione hydrolase [Gammaproteobacteria bacterium]|nr:MAG: hydroxyacylglutathione hydrolase [Gammaproteobacteria bacterium]
MLIKRLYMNNPLRNYSYIIVCEDTQAAAVIDPFDADMILDCAKENGWQIEKIINTHEHFDHIQGNEAVVKATQAKIVAHVNAKDSIPNVDHLVTAGDTIQVGSSIELTALDTPGHTFAHLCLFSAQGTPRLFCGDTLFNAGAGNCYTGNANALYKTFSEQLFKLPLNTEVYPGHDYITNNLEFSLDREPDNEFAHQLLQEVSAQTPQTRMVTTLEIEGKMNAFFRLSNKQIINKLLESFPDISPSEEQVFVHLRKLRDKW